VNVTENAAKVGVVGAGVRAVAGIRSGVGVGVGAVDTTGRDGVTVVVGAGGKGAEKIKMTLV